MAIPLEQAKGVKYYNGSACTMDIPTPRAGSRG